ncbi:hypothetical protein GCM10009717_03060 [Agromyces allii]|uniref:Uncharacterized protein n=1 Tax=Agromyces allii TaxID=393607 RepID=A0ABP5BCL9_9MICO
MRRQSTPTVPHRELFKAAGLQETVELACTCGRGVDHWYSRPGGPIDSVQPGQANAGRVTTRQEIRPTELRSAENRQAETRQTENRQTQTRSVSGSPRRSPAPAALAS